MRTYRSYEEFEREELRMELTSSVAEAVESMFYGELDFETGTRGRKVDEDDDE